MDFDAEEIAQLRKNILEFVLQQLHESAARGELRQAGVQLSGPIGAEVEAAITRALAAQQSPSSRLDNTEISRIAAAVARQIEGRAPPADKRRAFVSQDLRPDDRPANPDGDDDSSDARKPDVPVDLQRFGWPLLALLAGLMLGYGGAQFMRGDEAASAGTDSAQVVEQTQPAEDLNRVNPLPPEPTTARPAVPSGAPASGGNTPPQ